MGKVMKAEESTVSIDIHYCMVCGARHDEPIMALECCNEDKFSSIIGRIGMRGTGNRDYRGEDYE
jgi:hypothetical protein